MTTTNVQQYCDIIAESITDAETLKCPLHDWSAIGGLEGMIHYIKTKLPKQTKKKYMEGYVRSYDEFHQTLYGVVLFNIIGARILDMFNKQGKEVRVLDVGCGTSRHFGNMFKGHNGCTKQTCAYVGIDNSEDIASVVNSKSKHGCACDCICELKCKDYKLFRDYCDALTRFYHKQRMGWMCDHVQHKHVAMDVFTDVPHNISNDHFDIMILDIEPHGREWEVYEKFICKMKDEHLVILKCIGNMDMSASRFVYDFIDNVQDHGEVEVIKHFGWLWDRDNMHLDGDRSFMILNIWPRDVVCVMKKTTYAKDTGKE